ncbi:hypothetical protein IFM89_003213 [Coptis chinensis]|uniref:Uncharacterized protein n=1 Tax=Coptis chinensis TaxID=261450 RepID=A0A835LG66_9MAGN|nr:hypothetical protein IFM89_003213 [Coptis chinensis]
MFRSRHSASMDKNHNTNNHNLSKKSSSFSSREDPKQESPDHPSSTDIDRKSTDTHQETIREENELLENDMIQNDSSAEDVDTSLVKLSEEVDQFLEDVAAKNLPSEVPSCLEKFAKLVQVEIVKCVSGETQSKLINDSSDEVETSIFQVSLCLCNLRVPIRVISQVIPGISNLWAIDIALSTHLGY